MSSTPLSPPRCSLCLFTPRLARHDADGFASVFADVLAAEPAASALARLAAGAEREATAIVAPLFRAAVAADCAPFIKNDARLAARLGADGVHVAAAGEGLGVAHAEARANRRLALLAR